MYRPLTPLIGLALLCLTVVSGQAVSPLDGDGDLGAETSTSSLFLGGTCFEDSDGSGFMDEGEEGLPGREVTLMRDGSKVARVNSGSLGDYAFEGLEPGRYEVAWTPEEGWTQTAPGGGTYRVVLTDKPAKRLDFGGYMPQEGTAGRPAGEYPLMHPSGEEILGWMELHDQLPRAAPTTEVGLDLGTATGAVDLLDYLDYVPAERDQGVCGNCWVWAGTGLMEVERAVQTGEEERLSVQYFNSNYHQGLGSQWACCGGLLGLLTEFYSENNLAVPWSNANAQWQDGTRECEDSTSVPASEISLRPSVMIDDIQAQAITTHGVGRDAAVANVKAALDRERPVFFAFFLPSMDDWQSFFDYWGGQPKTAVWHPEAVCGDDWTDGAGHAVLCLGYDDTDPEEPYWIMVNSWGAPQNRPEGIFRVSMDLDYDCSYREGDEDIYAFFWETLDVSFCDRQPFAPRISGPSRGLPGQELAFSATARDPDGDRLKYTFDWGDGTVTDTAYVGSGSTATAVHEWPRGSWQIRAKATDEGGASSDWSDPLSLLVADSLSRGPKRMDLNLGTLEIGDQEADSHCTGQATNSVNIAESQ